MSREDEAWGLYMGNLANPKTEIHKRLFDILMDDSALLMIVETAFRQGFCAARVSDEGVDVIPPENFYKGH